MEFCEELRESSMVVDALAEGYDPFTGELLTGDTVLNDPQTIRFFNRLQGQLKQAIEVAGKPQRSRNRVTQVDYIITPEQIAQIKISERECFMKEIASQIDELTEESNGRKFPPRWIAEWLVLCGILEVRADNYGKNRKYPTKAGESAGFRSEERSSAYGNYTVTLINSDAQRFIIDNIPQIISGTPASLI